MYQWTWLRIRPNAILPFAYPSYGYNTFGAAGVVNQLVHTILSRCSATSSAPWRCIPCQDRNGPAWPAGSLTQLKKKKIKANGAYVDRLK
jgi:hypothetical protein